MKRKFVMGFRKK